VNISEDCADQLQDESLIDEQAADLVNDCRYLEAIKTDLQKYHDELMSKVSSHIKTGSPGIAPS
jgi:hypothetical protein